jgi:hypothetical protein
MEPRRLRRGVTLGAIVVTVAAAVAIAADPLPHSTPAPLPDTAGADTLGADAAALAAREARAAARLAEAERRLNAIAGGAAPRTEVPAAPVVSVAPPARAPVTRSASS